MPRTSYYRAPSRPPQSRWARHIDAWMRAGNLSQSAAFKLLRDAFDLGPESRSAFLPYLHNKPLTEAQEQAVARITGWPPEGEPEPEPATLQERAVLAAERQAKALEVIALHLTLGDAPDPEALAMIAAFHATVGSVSRLQPSVRPR